MQYGRINIEKLTRKKHGTKIAIEEEIEEINDCESPPPSPHIINKESLILVPNGKPIIQSGLIDQNVNEHYDKQVQINLCATMYSFRF